MATVVIQRKKTKERFTYVVHYKDPVTRRTRYYKAYQRQKDAQQAANQLRALIDSGKISEIRENKNKLHLLKFSEVGEALKSSWQLKFDRGELKRKTFDEYISRLRVIDRSLGNRLLCEISRKDIENYQLTIANELSNLTSNRSLFVIKQVFKKGLEENAIIEDYAAQVGYLSEKAHERNRFLLPDQIEKLVEASLQTRGKFYLPAIIFLGAEHGASKQEVLSLEWSDIDFDFDEQGIIRFFRTKNDRERTEFLMPRTKEALLQWRDHMVFQRRKEKIGEPLTNLVISHIDGRPFRRFYRSWRAACKIAGLVNFHYHDLRHTFCSNLLLSGSNLKDVKEMIGHSDIAMTDRYSHLTSVHKRLQQENLTKHYSKRS